MPRAWPGLPAPCGIHTPVVQLGRLGGGADLVVGRVELAVPYVVPDRLVEENRVLQITDGNGGCAWGGSVVLHVSEWHSDTLALLAWSERQITEVRMGAMTLAAMREPEPS
jgi:hypothetical protein